MGIFDGIFGKKNTQLSELAAPAAEPAAPKAAAEPKTFVVGGGSDKKMFSPQARNSTNLKQYRTIYEQGGVVSQAIDAYALYAVMNGYRLEGDGDTELVQEFLDHIDVETLAWETIIDALVEGDAYAEIIPTRGGGIFNLVPRDASTFSILYDNKGTLLGFQQEVDTGNGTTVKVTLKPQEMFHFSIFKSGGKVYGDSIIKRAFDDIMRDTIVMEGAANAIKAHGFRKYQIKCGTEQSPASTADLTDVSTLFQNINSKTEFCTRHDVEIKALDESGVQNLDTYHRVSVQRLCSSLGVPGDILGFREGTTDNTAIARIDSFFKKVSVIQSRIARAFNSQVIDRVTGKPGSVWIVFNSAAQPSENDLVNMYIGLIKADPTNPEAFVTRKQLYDRLGWDIEQYDENVEEDVIEIPDSPESNDNTSPAEEPAPEFLAQQEAVKAAAESK